MAYSVNAETATLRRPRRSPSEQEHARAHDREREADEEGVDALGALRDHEGLIEGRDRTVGGAAGDERPDLPTDATRHIEGMAQVREHVRRV